MSEFTLTELCICCAADAFRGDGEVLATSIGLVPRLGAGLAKVTFEPGLMITDGEAYLVAEPVPVGPRGDYQPKREGLMTYERVFDLIYKGKRHAMVTPVQIDRFGQMNISVIGDYAQPKTALLAECGQHWAKARGAVAIEATRRFLIAVGTLIEDHWPADATPSPRPATRLIEVTEAVTIVTKRFRFTKDFQGLETIQSAGSVIAHDGRTPVRTPYDNCVLIMPSSRLLPGQTAVRLGRYVD